MERIKLELTTLSNLFIGDTPSSFEIGGIDQYTKTDFHNKPLIPASSLKGVLRRIISDMESDSAAKEIAHAYEKYFSDLEEKNKENLKRAAEKIEPERKEGINERFAKTIREVSAEYLFGVQGFNDAPKLIFNDLIVKEGQEERELFSIDSKNRIDVVEDQINAKPRTYKTVRQGVVFTGDILLYRMERLGIKGIREFVEKSLLEFNSGIYRLGGSGSRGYGRVRIDVR